MAPGGTRTSRKAVDAVIARSAAARHARRALGLLRPRAGHRGARARRAGGPRRGAGAGGRARGDRADARRRLGARGRRDRRAGRGDHGCGGDRGVRAALRRALRGAPRLGAPARAPSTCACAPTSRSSPRSGACRRRGACDYDDRTCLGCSRRRLADAGAARRRSSSSTSSRSSASAGASSLDVAVVDRAARPDGALAVQEAGGADPAASCRRSCSSRSALALARPATRGREFIGDHVAIVIDTSASMSRARRAAPAGRRRRAIDLAKERGEGHRLGADARAATRSSSRPGATRAWSSPLDRDLVRVKAAIDRVERARRRGRPRRGRGARRRPPRQLGGSRRIVVITDGNLARPASLIGAALPLEVITVGEPSTTPRSSASTCARARTRVGQARAGAGASWWSRTSARRRAIST